MEMKMEPTTPSDIFKCLSGNLMALAKRVAEDERKEFDPHRVTLREAFDTASCNINSMMPPKDESFLRNALDCEPAELEQLRTEVKYLVAKYGFGCPLTDFVPENSWQIYIDGWKEPND